MSEDAPAFSTVTPATYSTHDRRPRFAGRHAVPLPGLRMSARLRLPLRLSLPVARRALLLGAAVPLLLPAQDARRAAADPGPAPAAAWDPPAVLRAETFVKPPAVIERIIMAPRVDISFENRSPDDHWFLRTRGPDRGDLRDYGKAHLWLAGVQVDTAANRARALTTSTIRSLVLVDPRTGTERALPAPAGAQSLAAPVWSPTGTHIAFIANFPSASHAFVTEVASGRTVQVSRTPLLATLVTSLSWTADGRALLAVLVPASRGPVPVLGDGGIHDGPQVRLTESRAVPQPVHFSLLDGPHDKALLTYYTTGQLALLDVRSRTERRIGDPRLFRAVDVAPDGRHARVTFVVPPFSYLVPLASFGTTQEVWDVDGRALVTLARTPLREGNPRSGGDGPGGGASAAADTSRRDVRWNPVGDGLVYLQNIVSTSGNGGRGTTGVRYVHWRAPFGAGDTATLYTGSPQFTGLAHSRDGRTLFVADSGAVIAVRADAPGDRTRLPRGVSLGLGGAGGPGGAAGRAAAADTSDNGRLLTVPGTRGDVRVLASRDGKSVYVQGTRTPGARWREQAPQPWLDRLDLASGARTRLFESAAGQHDTFVAALDDDLSAYLVRRQSRTTIPDVWRRDVATGATVQLTRNVDVAPEVTGAVRKRFPVVRSRDGSRFWVDVTLPRDWRPGTRLPGVIWFYPREYSSRQDYERSRYATNIEEFPAVPAARPATATSLWVAQGYAFIQPDIPIYGDAGRMNDNYTRDLEEGLEAVLAAVVDSGFVDRHRMGIGGHSYGAFSTVNAMTLVPWFKAGIAGDGMYNRTLTPFGFQSERRNFFEAQATYLDMSPFLRADKLAGALLLYHATEDQNVGTAPLSSTRLYQALQGLGKNAALYMYPYEDHSVATYQSDLDLWARWFAWFDLHVKQAPAGGVPAGAPTPD
jgi:dipeptidyl aminopeptidase/acylaminoacyl peptidase